MFSLFNIIDRAMERKVAFLATFFVVFTLTYAVFYSLDMLPETIASNDLVAASSTSTAVKVATTSSSSDSRPTTATAVATSASPTEVSRLQTAGSDLPQSLTINSLNRTVTVLNPASKSIASLDAALLKGVVRHPDSATLQEDGNLFILGHSSYLPTVHNRNFQAFNGIQNLKWGDTITVASVDTTYTYRVEKVYKAKASVLTIPVAGKGKRLTLATCNSFGSKDDRFIVEASLQSTKII